MKKILFFCFVVCVLSLVFSHPELVAGGCSLGLKLWYSAVLPSLLPFMILSGLLVKSGLFRALNRMYAPVLKKIFRISDDGCYAVLLGFLCGFPMGAKVVADLVREKLISPAEGDYLLGFCNNVSPAFFINYVCLLSLHYPSPPWKLILLFYSLPVFYGLVSRPFYHFRMHPVNEVIKKQTSVRRIDFPMLDVCIMDGFATITRLGGYIMLFTIAVQFLKLLPVSDGLTAALCALLEVSCGIDHIAALPLPHPYRAAFSCAAAALGGLCICAQTRSVLEGTPLSVKSWIRGRVILSVLAALAALLPAAAPALRGCW